MVLGRKTQVFNTVNQKKNFSGTLGCLKKEEISVRDFVSRRNMCDRKQDLQIIT